MARVVRFHETGGPEVLKIEQLDVPPPGKGEVQIRVKALGLNRAEFVAVAFQRGDGASGSNGRGSAVGRPWLPLR